MSLKIEILNFKRLNIWETIKNFEEVCYVIH